MYFFFYLYFYNYYFFGGQGAAGGGITGIFLIFFKKYSFINIGEAPPVSREHVHTGRPHTRIDNSILKKSNLMSFQ